MSALIRRLYYYHVIYEEANECWRACFSLFVVYNGPCSASADAVSKTGVLTVPRPRRVRSRSSASRSCAKRALMHAGVAVYMRAVHSTVASVDANGQKADLTPSEVFMLVSDSIFEYARHCCRCSLPSCNVVEQKTNVREHAGIWCTPVLPLRQHLSDTKHHVDEYQYLVLICKSTLQVCGSEEWRSRIRTKGHQCQRQERSCLPRLSQRAIILASLNGRHRRY